MRDDTHRFRTLMGRFVTGITVIAIDGAEPVRAMTANAFTAVSLDPLLLLVCIRNESRLLASLLEQGRFSVNVLAAGQQDVSRHYGGRALEHSPARWHHGADGLPLLMGANAAFCCRVESAHAVGDHTVIYGAVTHMEAADPPAEALVWAGGRYMDLGLAA